MADRMTLFILVAMLLASPILAGVVVTVIRWKRGERAAF